MLMACISLGFAEEQNDPFLYKGELNAAKVKQYITTSKFLPLSINGLNAFNNPQEKAEVVAMAKEQINRHHNYMAHYNAAVVYSVNAEPYGLDEFVPLSDSDAANAILNATKAIELGANNPAPYMYFLRGDVYMKQGTEWNTPLGVLDIKSHDYARKALADYEKVAELKPSIAPYGHMAALAEALRMTGKAATYQQRANAQQAAIERAVADRASHQRQAQRSVRKGVQEEQKKQIQNNFWSNWSLFK